MHCGNLGADERAAGGAHPGARQDRQSSPEFGRDLLSRTVARGRQRRFIERHCVPGMLQQRLQLSELMGTEAFRRPPLRLLELLLQRQECRRLARQDRGPSGTLPLREGNRSQRRPQCFSSPQGLLDRRRPRKKWQAGDHELDALRWHRVTSPSNASSLAQV